MGRLPSGWCGFQGSPWPTQTTVASLRLPASVQKSSDAFLVDRFMYRIQSGLVGGEAVVPHMGGALLVDDFQQPVDLLFQAVDIHLQGVAVAGDGLALRILDMLDIIIGGCVGLSAYLQDLASKLVLKVAEFFSVIIKNLISFVFLFYENFNIPLRPLYYSPFPFKKNLLYFFGITTTILDLFS